LGNERPAGRITCDSRSLASFTAATDVLPVSREDIARIIEMAPDAEWRLIISLARFGGLRVPSEVLLLKWSDVDWERKRIRISWPKTEHHDGRENREIPIFPELVDPL